MDEIETLISDALERANLAVGHTVGATKPRFKLIAGKPVEVAAHATVASVRTKLSAAWRTASVTQRDAAAAGKPERPATWTALGKTAGVLACEVAALEARVRELEARR